MYGAGMEMPGGVCVLPKRGEEVSKARFPAASSKKQPHAKWAKTTTLSWRFGLHQVSFVYDRYV